ncbi:hypothetical protein TcWFU_007156 [Taenia crassiceps]|uniref:Uncharacterized protein n=1 Tax=Taenia crassiceps TaxID=6207 RepID=A0ABR4Q4P3_9CEST
MEAPAHREAVEGQPDQSCAITNFRSLAESVRWWSDSIPVRGVEGDLTAVARHPQLCGNVSICGLEDVRKFYKSPARQRGEKKHTSTRRPPPLPPTTGAREGLRSTASFGKANCPMNKAGRLTSEAI